MIYKYDSHLHAVDVSPQMVEYSKSHFPHPRTTCTVVNIFGGHLMYFQNFTIHVVIKVTSFLRCVSPLGLLNPILLRISC